MSLFGTSCSNYLDIVPDNVLQYEDLFVSRKQAMNALTMVYFGIPYDQSNSSPYTMGDEWVVDNPQLTTSRSFVEGISIMMGNQSTVNTIYSLWTGNGFIAKLYSVIRDCDMFVQNVDRVPDMTAEDKADWKAQARFLRAWYMFLLVQNYGPIIIPKTVDPGELNEDLFLPRSKVEDCFDYIVNQMREAIPNLKPKAGINDLGLADQATAKAMIARVLLYRASPFYNGNSEYYSNFVDKNGEPYFAQTEDREKWKVAADAATDALAFCDQYGFRLYHFTDRPFDYDSADYRLNRDKVQTIYDLKMRITARWNEEIIWGTTRITTTTMSRLAAIIKPEGYGGPAPDNQNSGSQQGMGGASYQAMERYYTEHGLPLNEDRTVNQNMLHRVVTTPDETSPDYAPLRGLMQPGVNTINMYLHREPRFYADLGITGGYYRSHQVRIRTMMYQDTDGGYKQAIQGQYYNPTGIAIQKVVHPEAYFTDVTTMVIAPYPLIRVADLYLMKAEALNEYSGPSQAAYDAINIVRRRAGIPDVEVAYSNPEWVTDEALNKHLTQEGLREIILRERANEFAFEGAHRFYDMQRWKRSTVEFSRPIYGWNYIGTNATSFFTQTIVQNRQWSITDCLWPIDKVEIDKNANLVQNPGW
jgi:hypothetical protein